MKHESSNSGKLSLSTSITAGAVLLCAAAAVWAGPHGPRFPVSIEEAEARAEERFVSADADGNGRLSREEFTAAPGPGHHHGWGGHPGKPRDLELSAATDEQLFSTLDVNDDRLLSPDEFSTEALRTARRGIRRQQIFTHLDVDGDGALTREELPDMSTRLRAMDSNGDGVVTREEVSTHHRANGRANGRASGRADS